MGSGPQELDDATGRDGSNGPQSADDRLSVSRDRGIYGPGGVSALSLLLLM